MILKIIGISLIVLSLFIGYIINDPYNKELFENGETHMLGLKYMPPCNTFGANATCGLDLLLLIFWAISIMLIVVDSKATADNTNFKAASPKLKQTH